jgi:polysaccharide biosynthesis transport protein
MTLALEFGAPRQRPEVPLPNLEPPFRQVIRMLRRQRRLILTCALAGAVLGGIIGLMVPRHYTATAELLTEPQSAVLPAGQSTEVVTPEDEATIQSYVVGLTSRGQLEHVLDSLAADPPLPMTRSSTRLRFLDAKRRALSAWLAKVWATVPDPVRSFFSPPHPRQPTAGIGHSDQDVQAFKQHLHVFQEEGSHVLGVSFSSTDPQMAARGANRVAQLYVDTLYDQKRETTKRALAWIGARIPELKGQVDRAEAVAQAYRAEHGLAQGNQTDTLDQQLADLSRRVTAAEAAVNERQAQLDAVHESSRTGTAPRVQTYASRLAELQLQTLRDELAAAQTASIKARAAEAHLQDLERGAAITRQVYENLLQRREELIEQQQMIAPDVRILSLASPPNRPSSVNPVLFPLPTTIVFLIGGVLVGLLRDRLDESLRSARDVSDALGIQCIGLVPEVRHTRRTRPHQELRSKPFAPYAEAIRSLAASLQLAMPHGKGQAVLVSSSVPREGKTTLAVSLAVYAALIGRRVVLVDLDFRRPAIWREVAGKRRRRLSDMPYQECLSLAAIETVPQLGLDVLPIRRRPAEPLLPFAGGELPRLLIQLRSSYDFVVVDGPPLLAVTEARLLALLVDKVLFAVKWGSTRKDMARNALAVLHDARAFDAGRNGSVAGVVTQVQMNKHAQYRYGDVGESFVRYARYYGKGPSALPPWKGSPPPPARGQDPSKPSL